MTTTNELRSQIDWANRLMLRKYNDGRMWYLCDRSLDLAEICYKAMHEGDKIIAIIQEGLINFSRDFNQIPGDDFWCIYFSDSYWLKPLDKSEFPTL